MWAGLAWKKNGQGSMALAMAMDAGDEAALRCFILLSVHSSLGGGWRIHHFFFLS
jgi:hypothetical protein